MKKQHLYGVACLLALLLSVPASAQLAPPNDLGVALGHVHLAVKDVEAHKSFWMMLGGTVITNGPLTLIEFPGIFGTPPIATLPISPSQ